MDFDIVFYNVVVVVVFAALAYVFAKWWIVLFAALFIATRERRNDNDAEIH